MKMLFNSFMSIMEGMTTKDHEDIIFMYTNIFLIVIGIIFTVFVPGKFDMGIGIVSTAFVSLMPILVLFVSRKMERYHNLRGILKFTTLRTEPLFTYLKPEIENAIQVSLLSNILRKDFFSQVEFVELMKAKNNIEKFNLRICVYSPERDNPVLRIRAMDEKSKNIIEIIRSEQSNDEKKKNIDLLVNKHIEQMISDIERTEEAFNELKYGTEGEPGLGEKAQIRYVNNTYITNSILIADEKVVICDYLHQTGSNTPVLLLQNSPPAVQYKEDFERVWSLASENRQST